MSLCRKRFVSSEIYKDYPIIGSVFDRAESTEEVLERVNQWLAKEGIKEYKFKVNGVYVHGCWVRDGDITIWYKK